MPRRSARQNQKDKRNEKNCRSKLNQLKSSSLNDHIQISTKKNSLRNEKVEKSISVLAEAFANGFFTEVNCRLLPENRLDQLAEQVYQFVEKQG